MGKIDKIKFETFEHGTDWIRADFHLHTKEDLIEFSYKEKTNEFADKFVNRLKEENIKVGVITNHNKFSRKEFKEIHKKAIKNEIFLLPGVELSVNDGKNGIHCIIVFDSTHWIKPENDFINTLLDWAFEGNDRKLNCKYGFKQVLEKLDENRLSGRDSFVIMAHIEDSKGFYAELKGGRIKEYKTDKLFQSFVLGFQKVRSKKTIEDLKTWLGNDLPVFVEGSDCKDLNEIGKPHLQNKKEMKTYLKIGDFNFEAIKFALVSKSRVSNSVGKIENAFVSEISFIGGKLNGESIQLSPYMNNLIGIRGSGKSTILESIRYVFDIPFGRKSKDTDYKQELIEKLVESGGVLLIKLIDRYKKEYTIKRILREKTEVYRDETLIPNLIVNNNLANILYFGQKDLSEIGDEGFSTDLINKFFGSDIQVIRDKIDQKEKDIILAIKNLKELEDIISKKDDLMADKAALEENVKKFKEYKIEEKLKKQLGFEKDSKHLDEIIEYFNNIIEELKRTVDEYSDGINTMMKYKSKENKDLFDNVYNVVAAFKKKLNSIELSIQEMQNDIEKINKYKIRFNKKFSGLKDEFAAIKRDIKLAYLKPDDFVKIVNKLNNVELRLKEIEKKVTKYQQLRKKLTDHLNALNKLWHQEFSGIKVAVDGLNQKNLSIAIKSLFKENKENFFTFLEDNLRGTNIQKTKIKKITEKYRDTIELYNDLNNDQSELVKLLSGNQLLLFRQRFEELLETFLTYRVPDKYILYYKGEELTNLSLGQRASALILFILTKEDKDIIIIDQPEDDLDNQSIYNDVIKELKELKGKIQFIFATHNPNIPVLGDCEQIISCKYSKDNFQAKTGSIDCKEIQQEIVNIMEGGEEAFSQRNEIYKIWRPHYG